jgi:hypothetical protein
MERVRVSVSEIAVGQPLACDLYAAAAAGAAPLFRRGAVLEPGAALDVLIQKGLYADAGALAGQAPPSALRTINAVARQLEPVLHAVSTSNDAGPALRALAGELVRAAREQPDVAIAAVLLGQVGAPYAVRHCVETALVATVAARELGRADADVLCVACAALTMNVAMLGYHEQYQNRRGALADDELQTIRRHPRDSAAMLAAAGVGDADWLACVDQHHETPDGGGYPDGRTDLHPGALLLSLADRYCASVSARNYRRSQLPDQTLRELGTAYADGDGADCVAAFARALGAYPPGARVRLQNGETAVVLRHAAQGLPRVCVLAGAGEEPCTPYEADAAGERAIAQALHEDQAGLRFSMRQLWGDQGGL